MPVDFATLSVGEVLEVASLGPTVNSFQNPFEVETSAAGRVVR